MALFSISLKERCYKTLIRCNKFVSDESLRTVFVVRELKPYRRFLPRANSQDERVENLIAFLEDKVNDKGQLVFSLFLSTLLNTVPEGDSLYFDLKQLRIDIDSEYFLEMELTHIKSSRNSMLLNSKYSQPEMVIKIVKKFLSCPYMSERRWRDKVVSLLPGGTIQQIVRNEEESDFFDVLSIICACISNKDGSDGLEQLAHALYQLENESEQWQTLSQFLVGFSGKIVSHTRLWQLQQLLREMVWPDAILKRAYLASLPEDWLWIDDNNICSLLENLVKIPIQSDGTVPILEFVEHLALYAGKQHQPTVRNSLKNWIRQRADELGVNTNRIVAKVESYKGPLASYLVVALDINDDNTLDIQTWFLDRAYEPIDTISVEANETAVKLEQVPAFLDKILAEAERFAILENDFSIELFLPNELLCCDVDRWIITNDMMPVKIGIQHKVVVRSFKRARTRRVWQPWKKKWDSFSQLVDGNGGPSTDNNAIKICSEEQCERQERLYALLYGSSAVCLALAFAMPAFSEHTEDIFSAALSAGIPIALWSRKQSDHSQTLYEYFSSLLSSQTLHELPSLVWKQRLDAEGHGNEHHHGNYLTLLWDDPYRLPPSITADQFTAPKPRRGG